MVKLRLELSHVYRFRECSESCGIGILPVSAKQARRLPCKTVGKFDEAVR